MALHGFGRGLRMIMFLDSSESLHNGHIDSSAGFLSMFTFVGRRKLDVCDSVCMACTEERWTSCDSLEIFSWKECQANATKAGVPRQNRHDPRPTRPMLARFR